MLLPWSPAAPESLEMPLEEKIEEYIKLVVNHYMDSQYFQTFLTTVQFRNKRLS